MIMQAVSHILIALSIGQAQPADAALIEQQVLVPQAELSPEALFEGAMNALTHLPVAGEAEDGPMKTDPNNLGAVTTAKSAIVIDRDSGKVLFEKNAHAPRSIASMTKLMSARVFLSTGPDLSAPVALAQEDIRTGGRIWLRVGDEVATRDMLYASLVGSGNSETMALVRLSGMSEEDFVDRMNEEAGRLGLEETSFVDPTGLSYDNRSVPGDMARLFDAVLGDPLVAGVTRAPVYVATGASGRAYQIESTNELLSSYLNAPPYEVLGGKTGYLPLAGYSFGTIVSDGAGHELVVVVMGSSTKESRFQDAKALADWAYRLYHWPDEA